MQNTENKDQISTNDYVEAIAQVGKLSLMVDFFIKYPPQTLKKNYANLKFWKKALFNDSNLMDDPAHRVELLTILEQCEAMYRLASKFKPNELAKIDSSLRGQDVKLRSHVLSSVTLEA